MRIIPLAAALLVLALPLAALRADDPTPDEKAFIEKHISEFIATRVTRLADPALAKVFATPVFKVEVLVKDADGGSQVSDLLVARLDDKLVNLSPPGTDGEQAILLKMLTPAFKLRAAADATALQKALDVLYPPFNDEEKKALKSAKKGTQWVFIRGKFFDDQKGYVFETKPDGTITAVKYMLKLP